LLIIGVSVIGVVVIAAVQYTR
jgi:hypothetical protein